MNLMQEAMAERSVFVTMAFLTLLSHLWDLFNKKPRRFMLIMLISFAVGVFVFVVRR